MLVTLPQAVAEHGAPHDRRAPSSSRSADASHLQRDDSLCVECVPAGERRGQTVIAEDRHATPTNVLIDER
jgi:hypothetical protein